MNISNYKEDLKTIFQILSLIVLSVIIGKIDHPMMSVLGLLLIGGVLIVSLFDKIRYRQSTSLHEIRFPTKNDTFFKMTYIILGVFILVGSGIYIYLTNTSMSLSLGSLVIGLLVLANGLLDLPKGKL